MKKRMRVYTPEQKAAYRNRPYNKRTRASIAATHRRKLYAVTVLLTVTSMTLHLQIWARDTEQLREKLRRELPTDAVVLSTELLNSHINRQVGWRFNTSPPPSPSDSKQVMIPRLAVNLRPFWHFAVLSECQLRASWMMISRTVGV
jgi:hypothetical protein